MCERADTTNDAGAEKEWVHQHSTTLDNASISIVINFSIPFVVFCVLAIWWASCLCTVCNASHYYCVFASQFLHSSQRKNLIKAHTLTKLHNLLIPAADSTGSGHLNMSGTWICKAPTSPLKRITTSQEVLVLTGETCAWSPSVATNYSCNHQHCSNVASSVLYPLGVFCTSQLLLEQSSFLIWHCSEGSLPCSCLFSNLHGWLLCCMTFTTNSLLTTPPSCLTSTSWSSSSSDHSGLPLLHYISFKFWPFLATLRLLWSFSARPLWTPLPLSTHSCHFAVCTSWQNSSSRLLLHNSWVSCSGNIASHLLRQPCWLSVAQTTLSLSSCSGSATMTLTGSCKQLCLSW